MKIAYTKNFVKQSKKLPLTTKNKLIQRLADFKENPLDPTLRNHPLKGKYKNYSSINITGDVRALYLQKEDEARFDIIGTHSQLYG